MRSKKALFYSLLCIITIGSHGQVQPPAFTTGDADVKINWTKSKIFDQNGNIISETKSFFDYEGKGIQSQVKKKVVINGTTYNHVFASQPLYDALGRPVGNTLAAPINYADFKYQPNFATKNSQPYNYKNFDEFYNGATLDNSKVENPDAVDNTSTGTLGWYYSTNNSWEPYTAITGYPYSRNTFYKDGSGAVNKNAEVGEAYRLGSGHETESYIEPAYSGNSELYAYFNLRSTYFPVSEVGEQLPNAGENPLYGSLVKSYIKDQNGRKVLTVSDRNGKVLVSGNFQKSVSGSNTEVRYINGRNMPFTYEFINAYPEGLATYSNVTTTGNGTIFVYQKSGPILQQMLIYAGPANQFSFPTPFGYGTPYNGTGGIFKIISDKSFSVTCNISLQSIYGGPPVIKNCVGCPATYDESKNINPSRPSYFDFTILPGIFSPVAITDVSNSSYYFQSNPQSGFLPVDVRIVNLSTNTVVTDVPVISAFEGLSKFFEALPAGKYRVYPNTPSPYGFNVRLRSYEFEDVSFNYYNQLGQLVASIPPEGVKKLISLGYTSPANKESIPFISLFEYDLQGRLVKSTTPDGGMSELVYRKDGKIRFSQNAEQRTDGRYSYTHYDKFGRPVESGEFKPNTSGTLGIVFNADMTATTNPMRNILENVAADGGLAAGTGTKSFVTKTVYDKAVTGYSAATGSANYVQNFLRGGVSSTQKLDNGTTITSQTWYSYDEQGRVSWTIQLINGIGNTQPPTTPTATTFKTIDYEYDALGKVTRVIYQKQVTAEKFSHHYEYNPDQTLYKVYTSTNAQDILIPSQKSLQATYTYYLHGGLKRVELADKLQGIDYTYTLQGQLKAMNNADRPLDPGADGQAGANSTVAPDVFGMTLDYYPNDYQSAGGSSVFKSINTTTIPGVANQYGGQIRNMSWHTRKNAGWPATISDAPRTYAFEYDDKYQFTQSTWGNPDFGTNSVAATTFNQEIIKNPTTNASAYDANGNMQFLKRTNTTGGVGDNFQYNYQPNTNKLTSVNNYGTATNYAQYEYDNLGQLKKETPGTGPARYLQYDVKGLVIGVYSSATFTAANLIQSYTYDEKGQRISKYNKASNLYTYYVSDQNGNTMAIYTRTGTTGAAALREQPVYAADRVGIYYKTTNEYQYELKDHLGNVRAVIKKGATAGTAEILQMTDYYPYGYTIITAGPNSYRFGYQGQYAEKDAAIGWNEFDLRMYDSRIGRWLSVDPEGQYSSPYIGMGNDPVNNTDSDGGWTGPEDRAKSFAKDVNGTAYELKGGRWGVSYSIKDDPTFYAKIFKPNMKDNLSALWSFTKNNSPLKAPEAYITAQIKLISQKPGSNAKMVIPFGIQGSWSKQEGGNTNWITPFNTYYSYGFQGYLEGRLMPGQGSITSGDFAPWRGLATVYQEGPVKVQVELSGAAQNILETTKVGVRGVLEQSLLTSKSAIIPSVTVEVNAGVRARINRNSAFFRYFALKNYMMKMTNSLF